MNNREEEELDLGVLAVIFCSYRYFRARLQKRGVSDDAGRRGRGNFSIALAHTGRGRTASSFASADNGFNKRKHASWGGSASTSPFRAAGSSHFSPHRRFLARWIVRLFLRGSSYPGLTTPRQPLTPIPPSRWCRLEGSERRASPNSLGARPILGALADAHTPNMPPARIRRVDDLCFASPSLTSGLGNGGGRGSTMPMHPARQPRFCRSLTKRLPQTDARATCSNDDRGGCHVVQA